MPCSTTRSVQGAHWPADLWTVHSRCLGPQWGRGPRLLLLLASAPRGPQGRECPLVSMQPAGHAAPAPASCWGTIALWMPSGVARGFQDAGSRSSGTAPRRGVGGPGVRRGLQGSVGAGRAGRGRAGPAACEPPSGRRSWAEVDRSGSVCLPGGSQAWKCAPLSIPTVSLDAPATLCRDYLASAPGLVTAACLALRPPLLRHSSLPSQPRDPSVLRGGERTQSCLWIQPGPPSSVQEARSCVAQGSPPEAPPSRASLRCILLGGGQQRLPRPRCHSCRSPACGRGGLGDQPRFRDSGFMGLGAQGRGQWGLGCGQTALRKGPSAWWLNPETLPPVGGGQCPGRQPPLRLPSGLQLWEAPPFFTTPPAWLLP